MSELIFRGNNDKYGHKVIEAGKWYEREDGSKFFSSKLDLSLTDKAVFTDCGDHYMDYGISFDDFLVIADKIKELLDEGR